MSSDLSTKRKKSGSLVRDKAARSLLETAVGIGTVEINLLLTRRCNFSCSHCMYWSSPKMPADYMRHADIESIGSFMQELNQWRRRIVDVLGSDFSFGFGSLNLVGGEPTLDMEKFKTCLYAIRHFIVKEMGVDLGMTTNGWWLENDETIEQFGKCFVAADVRPDMIEFIRVSHSPMHSVFRSTSMVRRLAGKEFLRDAIENPDTDFSLDEYGDEKNLPGFNWLRQLFKPNFSKFYVETFTSDGSRISPVGRASSDTVSAWQTGPCGVNETVRFTFMPTREGEKPGRLYDVCCSGGKAPLGHAEDGVRLFLRRALYMEHLYKLYPQREYGEDGGNRCRNCPSTANAWVREKMADADRIIDSAINYIIEKS